MNDSARRLAHRVAVDPFFLSFSLAEYATAELLDETALAARLGTTPEVLAHVRLCRSPRPDPEGFRDDVARIAGKFGLDAKVLKEVARHGHAVAAMRAAAEAASSEAGAFLAARDKPPS